MRNVTPLPITQHGNCQRCGRAVAAREYTSNLPPDLGRLTCIDCFTEEEAIEVQMRTARAARAPRSSTTPAERERAMVAHFERARDKHMHETTRARDERRRGTHPKLETTIAPAAAPAATSKRSK